MGFLVLVFAGSGTHCYDPDPRDVARWEAEHFDEVAYELWKVRHPLWGCPSSLQVLTEYIAKKDIRDPWGHDYRFVCDEGTREMLVFSIGPDGRLGNTDDIRSNRLAPESFLCH